MASIRALCPIPPHSEILEVRTPTRLFGGYRIELRTEGDHHHDPVGGLMNISG